MRHCSTLTVNWMPIVLIILLASGFFSSSEITGKTGNLTGSDRTSESPAHFVEESFLQHHLMVLASDSLL